MINSFSAFEMVALSALYAGYNVYKGLKNNRSGIIGKVATKWGNRVQEGINKWGAPNWLKDIAHAANETILNPDAESTIDNQPDPVNGASKQVSNNSPNAVHSGGEGALYGTKPGARNPYDYSTHEFENIIRREINNYYPKKQTGAKRGRVIRSYRY